MAHSDTGIAVRATFFDLPDPNIAMRAIVASPNLIIIVRMHNRQPDSNDGKTKEIVPLGDIS